MAVERWYAVGHRQTVGHWWTVEQLNAVLVTVAAEAAVGAETLHGNALVTLVVQWTRTGNDRRCKEWSKKVDSRQAKYQMRTE